MLRIIKNHKKEIETEGKWLYRLFCTAAIAFETVCVATIAMIVACVALGI